MSLPSFEHMPSVPSATLTPWREQLRDRADARAELHVRDRVVDDRDAAVAHELDVATASARCRARSRRAARGTRSRPCARAACAPYIRWPETRLHARLEDVDVDHQVELVGERRAAGEHLVGAALRPGRRRADRDALVGPVEALDRAARERAPTRPTTAASRARAGRSGRARRAPRRARPSRGRRGRPSRARSARAGRGRGRRERPARATSSCSS